MPSSISVFRRRQNLVDLTVRLRASVTGFRFSAAANFDSAFTAFQVVPNCGFRSRSVPAPDGVIGSQFRDECRFVFAPSDYSASVIAVRDGFPFYVRVEPRNANGTFGPPEAMQIILPYSTVPNRAVILHGTAPAASPTGAVEVNLPGLCDDFTIKNQSTGSNLFISFDHGTSTGPAGPEFLVSPGQVLDMDFANASRVFVRGGTAGSAELYSVFTQKTQPLNL